MPLKYSVAMLTAAPVVAEVDAAVAVERLGRLGAGMRNPAPVVQGLAKAMRQHVKTAFAVGGFPTAWAPNKLNTVVAKGHSKPLHRARGSSGIEDATRVVVGYVGGEYQVTASTSAIGRFHQEGRSGPWTIQAKDPRHPLAFMVAGERLRGGGTVVNLGDGGPAVRAAFRARRARAQARRARTGRGSIPGRPGAVGVFALKVTHPGYPARPFMPPVDPSTSDGAAFLGKHWRKPLGEYLFGVYYGTRAVGR